MRVLIAYYSLSGSTEKLAAATAQRLTDRDVAVLRIVPVKEYSYFTAGVRGVREAMAGTVVALHTPAPGDESFDALVLYSPTWGWMSSPPVISFVAALPEGRGRRAVVGVTHAGGPIGSFERLAGLVRARGYDVVATLSVFCYAARATDEAAARAAAAVAAEGWPPPVKRAGRARARPD